MGPKRDQTGGPNTKRGQQRSLFGFPLVCVVPVLLRGPVLDPETNPLDPLSLLPGVVEGLPIYIYIEDWEVFRLTWSLGDPKRHDLYCDDAKCIPTLSDIDESL